MVFFPERLPGFFAVARGKDFVPPLVERGREHLAVEFVVFGDEYFHEGLPAVSDTSAVCRRSTSATSAANSCSAPARSAAAPIFSRAWAAARACSAATKPTIPLSVWAARRTP